MSDIDFDELDRAVNGALGGKPVQREQSPTPQPESPSPSPVVERTRIDSAPTPPVLDRPSLSAPAARRASGRFMDIMHPSSDMRTPTSQAPVINKPEPTHFTEVVKPIENLDTPAWNEPLESPFLADAKVEKRPLGGTPVEAPAKTFDFKGLLDEPEEELIEAPEPQERIEAPALPDPIDFAQESKPIEEAENIPAELLAVEKEAPTEPFVATRPVEEPTGPTSITQQYKEQPSSTQQSGAIFDTESYHQPVIKPTHKKPSWLIIVWILLLVLLGAAAGWAVYTFVLPML